MTTRVTIFKATLVQDSALSVSGLDREHTSDQPFTVIDGVPVISGRGLKGAAVAMVRRFFDPLPRSISETEKEGEKVPLRRSCWEFANIRPLQGTISETEKEGEKVPLRRSSWEFANIRPIRRRVEPRLRAGVGILQKTGARAQGVLYDREVVPSGIRWDLTLRVDLRLAKAEEEESEGILGYVLSEHWAQGRCWLGGGVARGLGWCHLDDLKAYRLDDGAYERWVRSGRREEELPPPESEIPTVEPTRSWCFRTLDVNLSFGEYRPDPEQPAWGVDMLAIGPHELELNDQPRGSSGIWTKPAWAENDAPQPNELDTDRALLMERGAPLIPGSSVRGPMRHALSRALRVRGETVVDPHTKQGDVGENDRAGEVFGTIARSSRVLIRDASAQEGWSAARLHMHAEDELSAGSYGSSKRDAVRLLQGTFKVRFVVEGENEETVAPLVRELDRLVELGRLGHLPVGGHKTKGAGWGRWEAGGWEINDVVKQRTWKPKQSDPSKDKKKKHQYPEPQPQHEVAITVETTELEGFSKMTLGEAVSHAREQMEGDLVAWWCEPAIDFRVERAPRTFGRTWPEGGDTLLVDEVAFFTQESAWRAAPVGGRWRSVLIRELPDETEGAESVTASETPARLHQDTTRFSANLEEQGMFIVREWSSGAQTVGYTLIGEER